MKKHIALLCLLLTEAVFFASWPTTLYLDGGGRWDYRVPIFFENKGTEDIVGESVAIAIPPDAPFIGQAAGTLRVVDDKGRQLKFAVEDKNGEIITDAAVTAGCLLHIPLSCPANSKTTYYVYYGNGKAWTSAAEIGIQATADITAISLPTSKPRTEQGVYALSGQKVKTPDKRSAEGSLFPQGLKKGIYIQDGKKVLR
jgi:hypothetical protein